MSCEKLLERTSLRALLQGKKRPRVITFDHNDTIGFALRKLAQHNILSAPVLLAGSVEDNDGGSYIGIVDTLGLLKSLVATVGDRESSGEPWSLDGLGAEWERKLLITATGHDVDMVYRGLEETPVLDIVRSGFLGGWPATGATHRVAVFDARGRVQALVSQSDVVRFLATHAAELGADASRTLRSLRLGQQGAGNVVVVPTSLSALRALEVLGTREVSAAGVVDERGCLVGNFSASDLRGLEPADVSSLHLPVLRFLDAQRSKLRDRGGAPAHLLADTSLRDASTLKDAFDIFRTQRVHRAWVVDGTGKPTGVVTLTDILVRVAGVEDKRAAW